MYSLIWGLLRPIAGYWCFFPLQQQYYVPGQYFVQPIEESAEINSLRTFVEALPEAHSNNHPHYSSLLEEVSGINALPLEHLSRCDLEGVTDLTLSGSFDTWG
ncbi:MAG: hypothetical protein BGO07_03555 [Alphaproteobacteria bacterium 40-19]|nr:MAG: hypothetical protein BGO07_03555 [Alphaproteobacteria bacterium 40-19]